MGCVAPERRPAVSGSSRAVVRLEPWREANSLATRAAGLHSFKEAIPIALGNERVLWIFGNCIVEDPPQPADSDEAAVSIRELSEEALAKRLLEINIRTRENPEAVEVAVLRAEHKRIADELARRRRPTASLIGNCIGLQQGLDPATAELKVFHGTGLGGSPTPFVASEVNGEPKITIRGDSWLVPVDAIGIDGAVFAIFDRFPAPGQSLWLSFLGQVAIEFDVSDLGYPRVTHREAFGPRESFAVGTALLSVPGWIYGLRDPDGGDVIRWAATDLRANAMRAPQYLGATGWSRWSPPPPPLEPDFREKSHAVTRLADGRYARVEQHDGSFAIALSPTISGPFENLGIPYRPPDAYSVAHPSRPPVRIGSVAYYPADPRAGLIIVYTVVGGELRFLRVRGL